MQSGIQLLDEAVRCMKKLREDPAYENEKKAIEKLAGERYLNRIREIALN